MDSEPQEPSEQETATTDGMETQVNDGQTAVEPTNTCTEVEEATIEEREMVDEATATAGEEAPTITAADERPEDEAEQERSPSTSQKRGRGRRKKFKSTATSERTDDATATVTS